MDRDIRHLIYILFCLGIGPSAYIKVFREKAGDISKANRYFLERRYSRPSGLYSRTGENGRQEGEYKRLLESIEKNRIRVIHIGGKDYPEILANIHVPPPVLFCRGSLGLDRFNVAVVGSRRCTRYGRDAASYISSGLSSMGITVVSGLALGIDSVAHIDSIDRKGSSIAVLGSGPDVVYPPQNRSLFKKIEDSGTVITEFPPGTPPLRQNFPVRNRIISGISRGVVIVEAGSRSGAMITGETALEQDREVFAVPGSIFSRSSRGCHRLIRSGARLVEDADDIMEEFQCLFTAGKSRKKAAGPEKDSPGRKKAALGEKTASVYENIGCRPASLEKISRASGLTVEEVLNCITRLEMDELVREGPSNHYRRNE